MLGVHPGHRANEPGIGHVDKRHPPLGLHHRDHRVVLQTPVDRVVEHASVVEGPVAGRPVHDREATAVEQFGNKVRRDDVFHLETRAVGQPFHLLEVLGRHERFLHLQDRLDHRSGLDLDQPHLDPLTRLLHQQVVHVALHPFAEQGPLLVPHFVGGPLEVQHGVTVDGFEPAPTTAGHSLADRLSGGRFDPGEQGHAEQTENPGQIGPPHGIDLQTWGARGTPSRTRFRAGRPPTRRPGRGLRHRNGRGRVELQENPATPQATQLISPVGGLRVRLAKE